MAKSGQIQTNTAFGYVRLTWSTSSQSVAGNSSTIAYSLTIYRSSAINSSASKDYSITINGATVASGTTTIGGTGTKTIHSGTTIIGHNADGTKTFSCSFSQEIGITWSGSNIGTVTGSGTGTLDTIPRATMPTLSTASVEMGAALTITTPRASTAFTHTLLYSFGSATGTIATGVGTSYTWTVPMVLANQIGNANSGVGQITCQTYNGATLVGTTAVAFTARVPESVKPYFTSIQVAEAVSGLAAKFGAYVQHKSKVTVNAAAIGAYASLIVSYRHEIAGWTYLSQNFTSGVLTTSGSITIRSYCTDTRGRTGTATTVINVLPYAAPSIAAFTAVRSTAAGVDHPDGAYAKVTMRFNIAPVENKNSALYTLEYREKGAASWSALTSAAAYSYSGDYVSTSAVLSVDKSYDLRLTAADYFGQVTATTWVSTAFTLMDFSATGKGLGIGKVSEKDALEIAIPVEINGQPIKGGAITVIYTQQQAITTGDYTMVNLNSVVGAAGSNLILDNNRVVCQHAGYVEISGMISVTGGVTAGDVYYGFIFKSTQAINIATLHTQGQWATLVLSPCVVPVAAGDTIYLQFLNNNARGLIGNSDNLAWMNKLTVKYVG